MARQSITNIWANAAPGTNLVTPDASKQNSGWLAEKPSFRIFNWFWQKITDMLQNVEKYGIMEWSAETNYPLYGLCMAPGSGIVYKSKQANNLNHAVTDAAWWEIAFIQPSSNASVRSDYLNDMVYQNTLSRKITVAAVASSTNDLQIVAYIGSTSTPTTLVARHLLFSDGATGSSASVSLIVPASWYFKIVVTNGGGSGTVALDRAESWEI